VGVGVLEARFGPMAPMAEPSKLTKFFGVPMKGPAPPPTSLPPSQTQQVPSSTPATPSKRKRAPAAAKISPTKGKNKGVRKSQLKRRAKNETKTQTAVRKPRKGSTAKWGLLMKAGLKAPKTSYTLWAADNQTRIQKELGTTNLIEVGKATGAQWKALSEEEKAPYKARQRELSAKFMLAREAYNDYCKGRGSNKDKEVRKRTTQKTVGRQAAAKKSRPAKEPLQSKKQSEATALDATQPMASFAPTQPEANAGQRRRAFKMPDGASVVAPPDLDATQLADPVVAAAACE